MFVFVRACMNDECGTCCERRYYHLVLHSLCLRKQKTLVAVTECEKSHNLLQ